jgi:rhodanese-related sulfurtransferase
MWMRRQAEQLVDAGKAVFVDVRPQHEYDQQHLPGARSIVAVLSLL